MIKYQVKLKAKNGEMMEQQSVKMSNYNQDMLPMKIGMQLKIGTRERLLKAGLTNLNKLGQAVKNFFYSKK